MTFVAHQIYLGWRPSEEKYKWIKNLAIGDRLNFCHPAGMSAEASVVKTSPISLAVRFDNSEKPIWINSASGYALEEKLIDCCIGPIARKK